MQPYVEWVLVIGWRRREADISPLCIAKLRMVELYLSSPIRHHDIVFEYVIKYGEYFTFYHPNLNQLL
jgi:hypothetical protein